MLLVGEDCCRGWKRCGSRSEECVVMMIEDVMVVTEGV